MSRGQAFVFVAILSLLASVVHAHTGVGVGDGFATGFSHPMSGLDHLVAMVAVGLWGCLLGMPAIWLLPVVFPIMMVLGGALSLMGLPLPIVETGIATSVLLLGAMVALTVRLRLWASALVIGLFAVFHGYAHGSELPTMVSPVVYGLGFVVATGLLHLVGIALGQVAHWPSGRLAVRTGGSVIALIGASLLIGLI